MADPKLIDAVIFYHSENSNLAEQLLERLLRLDLSATLYTDETIPVDILKSTKRVEHVLSTEARYQIVLVTKELVRTLRFPLPKSILKAAKNKDRSLLPVFALSRKEIPKRSTCSAFKKLPGVYLSDSDDCFKRILYGKDKLFQDEKPQNESEGDRFERVLAEIKEVMILNLKKVSDASLRTSDISADKHSSQSHLQDEKPQSERESDRHKGLLAEIKAGISLKKVSDASLRTSDISTDKHSSQYMSMCHYRLKYIHKDHKLYSDGLDDDGDDDDDDDDDDDWSDDDVTYGDHLRLQSSKPKDPLSLWSKKEASLFKNVLEQEQRINLRLPHCSQESYYRPNEDHDDSYAIQKDYTSQIDDPIEVEMYLNDTVADKDAALEYESSEDNAIMGGAIRVESKSKPSKELRQSTSTESETSEGIYECLYEDAPYEYLPILLKPPPCALPSDQASLYTDETEIYDDMEDIMQDKNINKPSSESQLESVVPEKRRTIKGQSEQSLYSLLPPPRLPVEPLNLSPTAQDTIPGQPEQPLIKEQMMPPIFRKPLPGTTVNQAGDVSESPIPEDNTTGQPEQSLYLPPPRLPVQPLSLSPTVQATIPGQPEQPLIKEPLPPRYRKPQHKTTVEQATSIDALESPIPQDNITGQPENPLFLEEMAPRLPPRFIFKVSKHRYKRKSGLFLGLRQPVQKLSFSSAQDTITDLPVKHRTAVNQVTSNDVSESPIPQDATTGEPVQPLEQIAAPTQPFPIPTPPPLPPLPVVKYTAQGAPTSSTLKVPINTTESKASQESVIESKSSSTQQYSGSEGLPPPLPSRLPVQPLSLSPTQDTITDLPVKQVTSNDVSELPIPQDTTTGEPVQPLEQIAAPIEPFPIPPPPPLPPLPVVKYTAQGAPTSSTLKVPINTTESKASQESVIEGKSSSTQQYSGSEGGHGGQFSLLMTEAIKRRKYKDNSSVQSHTDNYYLLKKPGFNGPGVEINIGEESLKSKSDVESVDITCHSISSGDQEILKHGSPVTCVYEFSPHQFAFSQPVFIRIPLMDICGNVDINRLTVLYSDTTSTEPAKWVDLSASNKFGEIRWLIFDGWCCMSMTHFCQIIIIDTNPTPGEIKALPISSLLFTSYNKEKRKASVVVTYSCQCQSGHVLNKLQQKYGEPTAVQPMLLRQQAGFVQVTLTFNKYCVSWELLDTQHTEVVDRDLLWNMCVLDRLPPYTEFSISHSGGFDARGVVEVTVQQLPQDDCINTCQPRLKWFLADDIEADLSMFHNAVVAAKSGWHAMKEICAGMFFGKIDKPKTKTEGKPPTTVENGSRICSAAASVVAKSRFLNAETSNPTIADPTLMSLEPSHNESKKKEIDNKEYRPNIDSDDVSYSDDEDDDDNFVDCPDDVAPGAPGNCLYPNIIAPDKSKSQTAANANQHSAKTGIDKGHIAPGSPGYIASTHVDIHTVDVPTEPSNIIPGSPENFNCTLFKTTALRSSCPMSSDISAIHTDDVILPNSRKCRVVAEPCIQKVLAKESIQNDMPITEHTDDVILPNSRKCHVAEACIQKSIQNDMLITEHTDDVFLPNSRKCHVAEACIQKRESIQNDMLITEHTDDVILPNSHKCHVAEPCIQKKESIQNDMLITEQNNNECLSHMEEIKYDSNSMPELKGSCGFTDPEMDCSMKDEMLDDLVVNEPLKGSSDEDEGCFSEQQAADIPVAEALALQLANQGNTSKDVESFLKNVTHMSEERYQDNRQVNINYNITIQQAPQPAENALSIEYKSWPPGFGQNFRIYLEPFLHLVNENKHKINEIALAAGMENMHNLDAELLVQTWFTSTMDNYKRKANYEERIWFPDFWEKLLQVNFPEAADLLVLAIEKQRLHEKLLLFKNKLKQVDVFVLDFWSHGFLTPDEFDDLQSTKNSGKIQYLIQDVVLKGEKEEFEMFKRILDETGHTLLLDIITLETD